jgi:hypothetical protein
VRIRIAFILAFAAAAASVGSARQSAVPASLDKTYQRELVEKIATLLTNEYVFPDVGKTAAEGLRKRARSGAYDTPRSPSEFASALTAELLTLTRDKHCRVRFAPDSTGERTPREINPAMDNYGVHKVEWLPAKIAYLKIDRFYGADESRAAFDAALTLAGPASAVVIDLRENGGGSDANVLLASYFFGDRTLFNEILWRDMDTTPFWTDPSVRPQLPQTPVYILTSARTFSAAEAFAYSMQQRKRATIVGERTAGGANPNRYFPLGSGLAVSISIGKTVNPVTKSNWEGVGVEPDIAVPAGSALDAATARIRLD